MIDAPLQFYTDMSSIAIQECIHLNMLIKRIEDLNYYFPCLPCTNNLQRLTEITNTDIIARILILSLYSEGKALDSKDRLLLKLKQYNKDQISANILDKIISDEVDHLKNGVK